MYEFLNLSGIKLDRLISMKELYNYSIETIENFTQLWQAF